MNVSEMVGACGKYDAGKRVGKATTAIHLFAVHHADSLSGLRTSPRSLNRTVYPSYVPEIHKGIRLAEYVQVTQLRLELTADAPRSHALMCESRCMPPQSNGT